MDDARILIDPALGDLVGLKLIRRIQEIKVSAGRNDPVESEQSDVLVFDEVIDQFHAVGAKRKVMFEIALSELIELCLGRIG